MNKKSLVLSVLVALFIVLASSSFTTNSIEETASQINPEIVGLHHEDTMELVNSTFSPDNLLSVIEEYGFKYPEIVFAQARLESGNFQSNLFDKCNNLFGMNHPSIRETRSVGSTNGFATFENWLYSVEDRFIYEELYLSNLTREEYFSYLGRVYAEDPNYVSKLKSLCY